MRTTLTLDDEVSVALKMEQKAHPEKSFKEIVNEAIKRGLAGSGKNVKVPFKIGPLKKTDPRPGLNFDKINELISLVEGDFHK